MSCLFSWIPELLSTGQGGDEVSEVLVRGMDGDGRALADWLARHSLDAEEVLLLECVAGFLDGRYRWVLPRLKDFSARVLGRENKGATSACALEILLLGHLVGHRMGETSWADGLLPEIDAQARRLGRDVVLRVLGIENAARLMGKGFYQAAIRALRALEPEFDEGSLFWAFRIQTLLGTCLQAIGRFAAAGAALALQETLARPLACANFRLSCLRRRMSLAWESERFEEASECWDLYRNDSAFARFPVIHALFLQEVLRLHLARHNDTAALASFSELERYVEEHGLSRVFLSLIEERAEMALRASRPEQALVFLGDTLREAALRGDLSGLSAVTLIQARALALGGRLGEASDALARVLQTAEEQGFGKIRVRALLFQGAVLHAQARTAEARASLGRALEIASEFHLPVQLSCATILARIVESGTPRLQPLLELQARERTTREVWTYLQFYQAPLQTRVNVRISGNTEEMDLPLLDVCAEMSARRVICLVPSEGVAAVFSSAHPNVVSVGDSEQIGLVAGALFRAEIRGGKGLSVEQIHGLIWKGVRYRPWQHGARLHSLMARVRRFLRLLGCQLEAVGSPAHYSIRAEGPLATAEVKKGHAISSQLTLRQKEFLELLREQGEMSTSQVCQRMGITRQTLHVMIQPVLARGLVKHRKRGRSSSFRCMDAM